MTRTPRLASYVRSLTLKCWDTESTNNDKYDRKVDFDGNLLRKLFDQRMGNSEEERLKWLKDLERDNSDAWLALLIPQLNELRKISLIWPSDSHFVLDMLQKAAIEEEPVFPHLEEAYAA